MVGKNSSKILKVTRRAKPEKEIQKIIRFMYHSDLYMQGRGLVPLSALADSSHLPRKLDLSKATVFFFIGCPGSGKSSIAVDFAAGGQYIHLSPSAILANIARNGPYPDQQVVEAAIATFKEVPDELLVLLTIREIQTHVESGSKLFIVDGFPQNANQFKLISRWLRERYLLSFDVDVKTISARKKIPRAQAKEQLARHETLVKDLWKFTPGLAFVSFDARWSLDTNLIRVGMLMGYASAKYKNKADSPWLWHPRPSCVSIEKSFDVPKSQLRSPLPPTSPQSQSPYEPLRQPSSLGAILTAGILIVAMFTDMFYFSVVYFEERKAVHSWFSNAP